MNNTFMIGFMVCSMSMLVLLDDDTNDKKTWVWVQPQMPEIIIGSLFILVGMVIGLTIIFRGRKRLR